MKDLCFHKICHLCHRFWSYLISFLLLNRYTDKYMLITDKTDPIERVLGIRTRERFLWDIVRMTENPCLAWFVVFSSASLIQEKKWSYWEARSKKDTLSEGYLRHRRTSQHRIISITFVYLGWRNPNNSFKRCCCLINAQRNSWGKKKLMWCIICNDFLIKGFET